MTEQKELLPEPIRQLIATWLAMQLDYHKTCDRMREAGRPNDALVNEARAEMLSWCGTELLAVGKRLNIPAQPAASTPICPFCDSGLVLTEQEADAIADLSQRLELRPATVIKQALRSFQLQVLGEPDLRKKADAIHGEVPAAAGTEAQDERKHDE